MSKLIGNRLPDEILRAFDGEQLQEKVGPAYLLVTTDDDGTPRPCMLSAGEVLAVDNRHIRVALWPGTTTARNLARGGRTLFCFVAPRLVYYAKGSSTALGRGGDSKLERFQIEIDAVESDIHQGMPVKNTIQFELESLDPTTVAGQWRHQIDALKS
jgi:hypothetical protein